MHEAIDNTFDHQIQRMVKEREKAEQELFLKKVRLYAFMERRKRIVERERRGGVRLLNRIVEEIGGYLEELSRGEEIKGRVEVGTDLKMLSENAINKGCQASEKVWYQMRPFLINHNLVQYP